MITPKEQTGAESIVYSDGTVTRSSFFAISGFKNQAAPEQTITMCKGLVSDIYFQKFSVLKKFVEESFRPLSFLKKRRITGYLMLLLNDEFW